MKMEQKIENMMQKYSVLDPASVNTDWFGSFLVAGMLRWSSSRETTEFAQVWLEHHKKNSEHLTDEEFHAESSAPRSRILRGNTILLSTYVGYYGVSYACGLLAERTGSRDAENVCRDVGKAILHYCARNNLGLVAHDDNENVFTIPDVAYFVIPPLFLAAEKDAENAAALRCQARIQLEGFTRLFFDPQKRLVKTLYRSGSLGKTYWIRASGWLLWTIVEALPFLSKEDPLYQELCGVLSSLAEGLREYQEESGAFHVLIDEPEIPLETTGCIMIANAIHKAVRMGWLDRSCSDIAERAWGYVDTKLGEDGTLTGCYSGWALPAEEKIMDFDKPMHWMPGMLLSAGAEFYK